MINFQVHNHSLCVGTIEILGVSSSSLLQVGDSDCITLYSMFDTPPESVIVGPIAPFPAPDSVQQAIGEALPEQPDSIVNLNESN
ncbi:MAG: hypothetical protein ACE3L7_25105 [Candidatus Pristimantibacillus sp.]